MTTSVAGEAEFRDEDSRFLDEGFNRPFIEVIDAP